MKLTRWKNISEGSEASNRSLKNSLLFINGIDKKHADDYFEDEFNIDRDMSLYPEAREASLIISRWIEQNKKIIIFGDYDVDGTSSTAILIKAFEAINYSNYGFHIPDRFNEGYGINPRSLKFLIDKSPDAVITVDCGISSAEEIDELNALGIEVLLTDHHNLPAVLPKAKYILNPKTLNPNSPLYNMCGAGVAFYLAINLLDLYGNTSLYLDLLQLAGMATIADLVPLVGINRLIVKSALNLIKTSPIISIEEMIKIFNISSSEIMTEDFAFKINPCINSAGRMQNASLAVEFMIADSASQANLYAKKLFNLNSERKTQSKLVCDDAIKMIENNTDCIKSGIIVVFSDAWHEGVLGIAASKLSDKYNRAAIVFAEKNGVLKGSARSIENFSIYDAINSVRLDLLAFGGHDAACGLSIEKSKLYDFISELKVYCDNCLSDKILQRQIEFSSQINPSDYNYNTYSELLLFEPFGTSNVKPILCIRNLKLEKNNIIGANKNTIRYQFSCHDCPKIEGIKFSSSESELSDVNSKVDILFTMNENNFKGEKKLQANIQDIRSYNISFCELSKKAFAFFSYCLCNRVCDSGIAFNSSAFHYAMKSQLLEAIHNNEKVGINNYESLLTALYFLFDSGISEKQLTSYDFLHENFSLFPDASERIIGVFNSSNLLGYLDSVNNDQFSNVISSQFKVSKSDLRYVYSKLVDKRKINYIEEIFNSASPLSYAVAIKFFEEAKFVRLDKSICYLTDGVHQTYEYDTSNVKLAIDKFLDSL